MRAGFLLASRRFARGFMEIIEDPNPETSGWIFLPHQLCKSLKPAGKDAITYIRVLHGDAFLYGRPLPHRDLRAGHIIASRKYSTLLAGEREPIKCYGKLPFAAKIAVSIVSGGLETALIKARLFSAPVCPGMVIDLGDAILSVASVEPSSADLAAVGSKTEVDCIREQPAARQPPSSTVTGLIEDPKSSLDHAYNRLYEMVCYPILYREQLKALPVGLPKGILLHGPPGVGKTHLVRRISSAVGLPLVVVNGPEILSSTAGESEENLRGVFRAAEEAAAESSLGVSLLFMDEIDSIAGKRTGQNSPTSIRVVAQLLTLLDGAKGRGQVIVVGATNRPNDLDPAIRRPGRFDRECMLEPPSALERMGLLRGMLPPQSAVDFEAVARATIGYVAADLAALHREAFCRALARSAHDLHVTTQDLVDSLKAVGPSLSRDYRIAVDPSVSLDSIGGYEGVKAKVDLVVMGPLRQAEKYARLSIRPPRGILLHGPPGCSKTTFAKAIANTAGCSFYSISGARAFSAFVGESERVIRDTFLHARMTAPSIIFIDEIDAMVGKRSAGEGAKDQVQERILSTFLNEMDGIIAAQSVMVLGATNRLEAIDSALLRPGRFDYLLEIPLPNHLERLSILHVLTRSMPIDRHTDLEAIASRTDGWSGAQLKNLLQEAALLALHKDMAIVSDACIEQALQLLL